MFTCVFQSNEEIPSPLIPENRSETEVTSPLFLSPLFPTFHFLQGTEPDTPAFSFLF